jgi:hypothetical protein
MESTIAEACEVANRILATLKGVPLMCVVTKQPVMPL